MLVAGIGVLVAIVARMALIRTRLIAVIPLQLLVCVSAGLIVGALTWLLWFGT
jgi:hypothetical protein